MNAPGAVNIHAHPAWFGSVMGTAGFALAVASQADAWTIPALGVVAMVLVIIASGLALALWPRYMRRLSRDHELGRELSDPAHGAMLATFPAGLLVLAVAWGKVGPEFIPVTLAIWIDIVLAVIGTVVAFALSAAWATSIARSGVGLEGVNGGWLIPPVMNLIVPLTLIPIMGFYPETAGTLLVIAGVFYGIGAILFLSMLTLLIARLALRDPLPGPMTPSLWIPLAPAGILGLSLLRIAQSGVEAGLFPSGFVPVAGLIATMGIGFGLWWSAFAYLDLRRVRQAKALPYHPGWWGFVFPVAAMSLSITAVGAAFSLTWVLVLGAAVTLLLAAVWLLVATRTAKALTAAR
jgi:C4-dicarboxylate transporter/malic acid transport protein